MNKRGVSPIIATVLLISFVIIIAVVVYLWYENIVRRQIDKEDAETDIQADCQSAITLELAKADYETSSKNIKLKIRNIGAEVFHGIKLIVEGDENIVFNEKQMFKPGKTAIMDIYCENCDNPSKIQVIPLIVRNGVLGACSTKKVVYNL